MQFIDKNLIESLAGMSGGGFLCSKIKNFDVDVYEIFVKFSNNAGSISLIKPTKTLLGKIPAFYFKVRACSFFKSVEYVIIKSSIGIYEIDLFGTGIYRINDMVGKLFNGKKPFHILLN